MLGGLTKAACYRAILRKDRQYDGIFYFAVKASETYCRPSCTQIRLAHHNCLFFDAIEDAKAQGYQACKHCCPDRLKDKLSTEIFDSIDAGAINDLGVHGLADSLHISERQLRRIVRDRTGTSPVLFNRSKRLGVAELLVTQTNLPIIDIAFNAEFSSLRQFNDVFKEIYKTSPREMRRVSLTTHSTLPASATMAPLRLSYTALLHRSAHQPKIKVGYEKV